MNNNLTTKVKDYAMSLGANLVGIAPISRFENAPIMMSPKGIMPTAKCVIVCAVHHPDGAIQMGGEKHPQDIGPYAIQYAMNEKLDYLAYHIANFVTDKGYDAIPIASSNIWRYRKFMGLDADFAPDMSHIYAATCAGLGQLGWHGLTMTPEYGAWNRFISIITDAPLTSTPMYDDLKLCDMCGECINHCPTDAYRKEVKGINCIEVEGRSFKFANKNLWRCAWGEHFDLDLDLKIPDVVTEEVLLETKKKYGSRGGEMGCCLKYCLPKHLRQDGGDFTSTYIRKKHSYASDLPIHRALYDKIIGIASRYCVDDLAFINQEALDASGADYKKYFSKAKGAVVYAIKIKKTQGELPYSKLLTHHGNGSTDSVFAPYENSMRKFNSFANLDITLAIENAGFESVCDIPKDVSEKIALSSGFEEDNDYITTYGVVLVTSNFKIQIIKDLQEPDFNPKKSLGENIAIQLKNEGSHNFAIARAERFDKLADILRGIKGNEKLFLAKDKNIPHIPFDPIVKSVSRKINKPSDFLKGAKNVIVFGLHYPDMVAKMALKPPAYAVGPYVFASYETLNEIEYTGLKACKYLQGKGYNAIMTHDLTGIGSDIGSPRGLLNDTICNSLEAVEAGIGELALSGNCYTSEHGFNQRFMAIITDAPIEEMVYGAGSNNITKFCDDCKKCLNSCPAKALNEKNTVKIELAGKVYNWIPADSNRCDWSKKHSLCAEDGIKYTGSLTDVPMPDSFTSETLVKALKTVDPVFKARPTIAERCVIECPLVSRV